MLRKLWLPTFITLLTLINLSTVILNQPTSALAQEGISVQVALGTAFTYQGRLTDANGPVNATCDFQFSLFDATSGGSQIGNTQTTPNVAVSGGLFTTQLNGSGEFGPTAFTGQARWIQIAARCPAGSGNFTLFDPRQPLSAAPYSLFSRSTGALNGQPLSGANPAPGNALAWNGSQWAPTDLRATTVYTRGQGSNPVSSLNFLAPTVQVTVLPGQKVTVISSKDFGSTLASGGLGLLLSICYQQLSAGSLQAVDSAGSAALRVAGGTRVPFTIPGLITGLNGTYNVGLCGYSNNTASWNDNGLGFTLARVEY